MEWVAEEKALAAEAKAWEALVEAAAMHVRAWALAVLVAGYRALGLEQLLLE
jgi:hypothetical protein